MVSLIFRAKADFLMCNSEIMSRSRKNQKLCYVVCFNRILLYIIFVDSIQVNFSGICCGLFLYHATISGLKKHIIALLENSPSAPAEKGQRNRFPNRCPATETNGLAIRHQVFQPVPQASIGTGWKDQLVPQGGSPLWYRLVFPTGTNDIFSFFLKSNFICYIYYYLFFYNC